MIQLPKDNLNLLVDIIDEVADASNYPFHHCPTSLNAEEVAMNTVC